MTADATTTPADAGTAEEAVPQPVEAERRRFWTRSRTLRHAADIINGRHVRIWLTIIAATALTGTAGYVVLFRWSLIDSAYMTVITMTTVGFREVRDLVEWPERLWTMLIAVAGVGIIYGSIGIVAEAVVAEASSTRREERRMAETIASLSGHYLLCGYGRVGSTVARELVHAGEQLVVIDIEPSSLERARQDGHLIVEGDATSDDVLRKAGIARARGLVATIDSDANNVYVTLSARALNPRLFVVGRANAEGSEAKLEQAGADRVVSPYTMAGRRMAELAIRPRVADFIDAALSHGNLRFSLEELQIEAGSFLDGTTVGELLDDGVFTLAVVHGEQDYEANPTRDRVLVPGESLVVSGSTEQLRALRARA